MSALVSVSSMLLRSKFLSVLIGYIGEVDFSCFDDVAIEMLLVNLK